MGPQLPRYREAYPQLNILKANSALQNGLSICQFVDEIGRIRGQACFVDFEDHLARLAFTLSGRYFPLGEGRVDLPIERVPSPTDPNRHYFRCPGCSKRVAILIWNGTWACGECHQLIYRRQLISPEVVLAQRLTELNKLIGKGRPLGMRQTTYAGRRRELEALKKRFRGYVLPVSSSAHDHAISETWLSPAALTHGLWISGWTVRDGVLIKIPDG